MTAAPDETPSLCVLCPPLKAKATRPGGMTDWDCHDRLGVAVLEIVARYARLTAVPTGNAGYGRRAPGFRSKPPLDIHIAALRDPRTAPETVGEMHSPLNLFLTWARWIRQARRQLEPGYGRDVDDLTWIYLEGEYLTRSMDWITRQPWVTTFAAQLRAVVAQLRSATGEPNPRPVGTCRVDGCGHPLFPPRSDETAIRCGGCDAVYEPLDLIRMQQPQPTPDDGECASCGHDEHQHDNDSEARPCNVRWCDCPCFIRGGECECSLSPSPTDPSSSTAKPSP